MAITSRWFLLLLLASGGYLYGQAQPQYAAPGTIPLVNVGGSYMDSRFSSLDFAQIVLDQQKTKAKAQAEQDAQNQELVGSGMVSILDLQAPAGAVREFNTAAERLREQKSTEAIAHLEKAIKQYHKFVSAYNDLGLAYQDLGDSQSARAQFEIAAKVDPKFAGSFVNLGHLELAEKNVDGAEADFEKAAALRPRDASVLTLLCYTQHGTHQFRHAIDTAVQVHKLDHKGLANVHYIAAASAIALHDYPTVRRELELFVKEDPANPLAPAARHDLEVLARNNNGPSNQSAGITATQQPGGTQTQTFPNSERLRSQLAALGDDPDGDSCADCGDAAENSGGADPISTAKRDTRSARGFTFRKTVDEVVIFFAVTRGGHSVTDLQLRDIKVLDDHRPPEKLLQFAPQSKLPLHLGLLIDTSGSVKERFSFEKRAASKFVQEIMRNPSDLAFVAGFSTAQQVTQDFTGDLNALSQGISSLKNAGGTALFDAISFACWKLAAYPERERVANVLVVLSDGEDNSSSTSLKQAIRDAEATGVTIYTISTQDHAGARTDADKVLTEVAERTGGEALFPGDLMMLSHSFEKLQEIIRSRYLLAYKPPDFVLDGRYRTINIVVKQHRHQLQVHARRGYYAR